MLLQISALSLVLTEDDEPLADPKLIAVIDGSTCELMCSDYIDADLADQGISGGAVRLEFDQALSQFRVVTEYSIPDDLSEAAIERLVNDTRGQWSDGIGACGFSDLEDTHSIQIQLDVDYPNKPAKIAHIDGGVSVLKPLVASAARRGQLHELRQLIDANADIDMPSQGYFPIHLAILYGHVECALELIRRGANLQCLDPSGLDPLLSAALSNNITDEHATTVAESLIANGVPPQGYSPEANQERSPLFFAELRRKVKLASFLHDRGAS